MKISIAASFLALAVLGTCANAQMVPPNPPAPPPPAVPQDLAGTLLSWNFSPRGDIEGLILKTADGIVQINLPPEASQKIAAAAAVGDAITATAESEPAPPAGPNAAPADHPVFHGLKLVVKGVTIDLGGPGGPGQNPADQVHVESTVKAFNYDHKGTVNGAMLDSGALLTFGGPKEAQQISLKAGDKVVADGTQHVTPSGLKVIDAMTLNGTSLRPAPGPRAGPGGPGPGGAGGFPPPAADPNAPPQPPRN